MYIEEYVKDYQLTDYYEDYGIIGYFDTLAEAKEYAEKWSEETDRECDLEISKWESEVRCYGAIF